MALSEIDLKKELHEKMDLMQDKPRVSFSYLEQNNAERGTILTALNTDRSENDKLEWETNTDEKMDLMQDTPRFSVSYLK